MKTKILLMAALLAATTAFFSCSSDETLAEVLPEEPQPAEVLPTDSGIPLTVTASTGNDTRATMLTSSNFDSFQLWAFEGATPWVGNAYDAEGDPQSGTAMTKTSGSWNAPGANWPSPSSNSNFYAISAPTSNNLTPQITQTSQSFTYTVPEDAAQQVDLMVGAATASAQTDNGKINIDFRHILSKLNFTFKLDPLDLTGGGLNVISGMGFNVLINKVTLGGIKNEGKFTFASGYDQETATDNTEIGSWDSDESAAEKTVVIPFTTPLLVAAGFDAIGQGEYDEDTEEYESYDIREDEFGAQQIDADDNIASPGVILPQTVETVWDGSKATILNGAYVAIEAKIFWYYKEEMTEYLESKGYTLVTDNEDPNYNYYVDVSKNRIARKGGVILDYTKIGNDYTGDIQITTSDQNDTVGAGEPGLNNPNNYSYGSLYKKLGSGSLTFTQGKPFRLTINLASCMNQNDSNAWGDMGSIDAAPKLVELICE